MAHLDSAPRCATLQYRSIKPPKLKEHTMFDPNIPTYRAALEFKIGPHDISSPDVEALLAEHAHAADKHGYAHLLTNPELPEIDKLSALMEEVGEVAQLLTYDKRPDMDFEDSGVPYKAWRVHFAKELLQVANLALAWHHSVVNGGN